MAKKRLTRRRREIHKHTNKHTHTQTHTHVKINIYRYIFNIQSLTHFGLVVRLQRFTCDGKKPRRISDWSRRHSTTPTKATRIVVGVSVAYSCYYCCCCCQRQQHHTAPHHCPILLLLLQVLNNYNDTTTLCHSLDSNTEL